MNSDAQAALIGAFVGALLGVGAALLLDWNRTRLHSRKAARLLFFEVANNAHFLWQVHKGFAAEFPTFMTSAWEATRFDLTGVLSAQEFRDATLAYIEMEEFLELERKGVLATQLAGPASNTRDVIVKVGEFLARRGWPGTPPAEVATILEHMRKPDQEAPDLDAPA